VSASNASGIHDRDCFVKRLLLRSTAFVRATRRMLRKHPQAPEAIQAALELLTEDAFHPQLPAHKLKSKLEGSRACSAGYDLRIVLTFVPYEGSEAILLQTVGTHEEMG
jgi:mRNA interferase YafQ